MTTPDIPPLQPAALVARRVTAADHDVMHRLWQLFRHDLSAVTGALPKCDGRYRTERLDRALAGETGWQAWLLESGPHPVGLAVARALDEPVAVISSFFVVAGARRTGAGRRLVGSVVATRPGRWSVAHQQRNAAAAAFWPAVAADLDPGWTSERRPVPGRPELPPDTWVTFSVTG